MSEPTPEELRSLYRPPAPKPEEKPAPKSAPKREPVPSPLESYFQRVRDPAYGIAVREQAKEDLGIQPAPEPVPEPELEPVIEDMPSPAPVGASEAPSLPEPPVPPITPAEGPQDPMQWSENFATMLGVPDIAEEISEYKATVMGQDATAKLRNTYLRQGQRTYGRFGTLSPEKVRNELYYANVEGLLHRQGLSRGDFWSMPDADRERIKELARTNADRVVASIIGTDEQRGNVLVDLDPERTLQQIADGETAVGYLTGVGVASQALKALGGEELADKMLFYPRRFMAPFYAMLTPGGRSVEPSGDNPILGMHKEGKLHWFFRAGLWSVIGAHLTDPEQELFKDWGSEEHIKRIYAEGYDVIDEMQPLGHAVVSRTPFRGNKFLEQAVGFSGIMGLILFEPDLTLLALGAGKLAKPIVKAAKGIKHLSMLDGVFIPFMKSIAKRMDDGESTADILKEVPRFSPRWAIVKALHADHLRTMKSKGAPLSRGLSDDFYRNFNETVEEAKQILGKAREEATESWAEAQARRDAGAKEWSAILRRKAEAEKLVETEKRMAQSLADTIAEELRVYTQLEVYAKRSGRTMADVYKLERKRIQINDALRAARERANFIDREISEWGIETPHDLRAVLELMDSVDDRKALVALLEENNLLHRKIAGLEEEMMWAGHVTRYIDLRSMRQGYAAKVAKVYTDNGAAIPAKLRSLLAESENMLQAKRGYRGAVEAAENAVRAQAGFARKSKEALEEELSVAVARAEDIDRQYAKAYDRANEAFNRLHGVAAGGRVPGDTRTVEFGTKGKRTPGLEEGFEAILNADKHFKGVLRRHIAAAEALSERYKSGKALDDTPINYANSEVGRILGKTSDEDFVASSRTLPWDEYINRIEGRYGKRAVSQARAEMGLEAEDALARVSRGSGGLRVAAENAKTLLELERAAFAINRAGKINYEGVIEGALQSVREVPGLGRRLSYENALAYGMRVHWDIVRTLDPIISRIGNAPKVFREVYRKMLERVHTNSVLLGRIAREHGSDGAHDLIFTNKRMTVGGNLVTLNQDTLTPFEKAYLYLKQLARSSPDEFANDITAKAFGNAWIPQGKGAPAGAAAVRNRMRDVLLKEDMTPELFKTFLVTEAKGKMMGIEGAADVESVAYKFLYEGSVHGAAQYDAIADLMKSGAPLASRDAANALNYITGRGRADLAGDLTAEGIKDAQRLIGRFTLPFTEAHKAGRVGYKEFLEGTTRIANEMAVLGSKEGDIAIPRYLKDAMDGISPRLAKATEQFAPDSPHLAGLWKSWMRMWTMSVVNGWFLTRIAHFGATFAGDLVQMVSILGFRNAARIAFNNTHTYFEGIPFIGKALKGGLESTAGRSMFGAMTNPQLTRMLQGDPDLVFDTIDGPITAAKMLEEGRAAGALDSISSKDLAEVMGRVPPNRMREFLGNVGITGPSLWVRRSAELMENLQHRLRMQVFMEARLGYLTGKPETAEAAGKLMRDTLFDWRLGVTPWESETIGRIAAFWTFKRQMLRQGGSIIADAFTQRPNEYLWRTITGQTMLGRTRKMGAIVSSIPEAIYWDDPEQTIDDEQQAEEYGKRTMPWWADAAPVLFSRRMSEDRQLWFSEVAGKPVSYESLILPGLTTLDAMYAINLMANSAAATMVEGMNAAGIDTGLTTEGIYKIWQQNVDTFADGFGPGVGPLVERALGGEMRRSSRGVAVPANTAIMLNRLGWGEFLETYIDKDGRQRYVADSNALTVAGRIIAEVAPPAQDILRNWAIVDNPGFSQSFGTGVVEGFARLSGLVRYGQMDPIQAREWAVRNEDHEFKEALRSAGAQTGSR